MTSPQGPSALGPRIGAVTSLGMGGTNVHAVLSASGEDAADPEPEFALGGTTGPFGPECGRPVRGLKRGGGGVVQAVSRIAQTQNYIPVSSDW